MVTIKVPFFRRADFLIPIAIATALIISVGVASAVDLERGLVAYYSFDDCSAKDLSGNGNDGIIYGAKCVDGKFGRALSFDGVNDYVEVPHDESLDITTWSIMAWIYPQSGADEVIYRAPLGHLTYQMQYHDSSQNVDIWFEDSSDADYYVYSTTSSVPLTTWSFVVGTYDGKSLKVYINSVLDNSKSVSVTPNTGIQPLWIGKGDNGYFHGIIDEVCIYNRALSEEEIRALYEQGVAPRPKLAIEMDIDTSLKQGEVRKGTIRVENIGNSDAKSVKVRLFSEGLGIDVEKSYAKIPSGEAREFLFEVSANEAGTFKLSAYAEYWDDKGNKYVETADKFVHVEAVVLPTSQPTSQAQETPEARETARPAGFYAFFASLLIAVSYFLIRLRGKKN